METPAPGHPRPFVRVFDGVVLYPRHQFPGRDTWLTHCLSRWAGQCVRLDDVMLSLTPVYRDGRSLAKAVLGLCAKPFLVPVYTSSAVLLSAGGDTILSFVDPKADDPRGAREAALERGRALLRSWHPGVPPRVADDHTRCDAMIHPSVLRMDAIYGAALVQAQATPAYTALTPRVCEARRLRADLLASHGPREEIHAAGVIIGEQDRLAEQIAARARADMQRLGSRVRQL